MIFGEYDYETDIRVQREEAKEEGIKEGLKEGRVEGIELNKLANAKAFIQLGKLTLDDIASCCELPLEKVKKLAEEVNKS